MIKLKVAMKIFFCWEVGFVLFAQWCCSVLLLLPKWTLPQFDLLFFLILLQTALHNTNETSVWRVGPTLADLFYKNLKDLFVIEICNKYHYISITLLKFKNLIEYQACWYYSILFWKSIWKYIFIYFKWKARTSES